MGRPRTSEAEALERRRRERDPNGGAVVDMRIDIEFNGELVLSFGGRWDRRLEEYDGEAETGVIFTPHAGQMPAVEWFKGWLGVHAGRRDDPPPMPEDIDDFDISTDPSEVFSSLFAGGRRGGKTRIGAVFCAGYAVQFADAIVWVVNPSAEKHDEVRRYMSTLLAPEWVTRETADGWELVNGSIIALKSGYVGADPDAIKEGEAHLIWLNEGQKMAQRVYTVARGAIADHSGLVLICANPPVEAKDEQWVGDFGAEAAAGKRASVYLHFNPMNNPFINRRALLSMKRELDERTFRIEILGEFLPPADTVAYNWSRTPEIGNERAMPQIGDPYWIDVTAEFLEMEDEGAGFTNLVGMDFQINPHIGGPVYRIYAPRSEEPTRKNVVAWIVDEIILDGADELEWAYHAKEERGYDPETTMIIGDATGEYQHTRRRQADSPPPEWTGKGSYDILRQGGFMHIRPPSRRIRRKNPDVIDRVRSFQSLIENAMHERRLFADPDRAPKTCKAIRGWKNVHGKPSRIQLEAHIGDAASYPIIRLFPRILRSDKTGGVDTVTKQLDREHSKPSFLGPPPAAPRRRGRRERGL